MTCRSNAADDLLLPPIEARPIVAFLKAMEFTTITKRVAELYDIDVNAVEPDERLKAQGKSHAPSFPPCKARAGKLMEIRAQEIPGATLPRRPGMTGIPPPRCRYPGRSRSRSNRRSGLSLHHPLDDLDAFITEAQRKGLVAVDTETNSLDPMQADLLAFRSRPPSARPVYVPLLHKTAGAADLFGGAELVAGQIPQGEALTRLKPLLEDASVLKIGQNLKYDYTSCSAATASRSRPMTIPC